MFKPPILGTLVQQSQEAKTPFYISDFITHYYPPHHSFCYNLTGLLPPPKIPEACLRVFPFTKPLSTPFHRSTNSSYPYHSKSLLHIPFSVKPNLTTEMQPVSNIFITNIYSFKHHGLNHTLCLIPLTENFRKFKLICRNRKVVWKENSERAERVGITKSWEASFESKKCCYCLDYSDDFTCVYIRQNLSDFIL